MRNARVVPWYDSTEWLRVYSALFSPTSTTASKRAALGTLLAWKARQPTLVSGVESTLGLLEVESQLDSESDFSNENVIRLAYATALMRFVNLMLDSEQKRGLTLYRAAKQAELPDWIIDIRHSAAHGDSLPSLDLLRRAAKVAIEWLRKNYWDPQKESIADYVVGTQTISEDNERRLSRMISFYASLSICSRTEPKIKYLSQIPDSDMKVSIVEEAQELFDCGFLEPDKVSLQELIKLLSSHSSKLLKNSDASAIVNRTLLDENSLLLSVEVLESFDEKPFENNGLSKKYLRSWDILLFMLHTNNLIAGFVEDLVGVSNDGERSGDVRELAAHWTKEILRALMRSKMYIEKLEKLKASGKFDDLSGKNHQAIFQRIFPHEKTGLTLNLIKPIPEELTKISFVRRLIKSYNPYLYIFIKDLLTILKPRLGSKKEEKICKMAEIISGRRVPNSLKQQVYTVDCVEMEKREEVNRSNDSDCMVVDIIEKFEDDRWKLASSDHDWSKCPIGVLPWQIKNAA